MSRSGRTTTTQVLRKITHDLVRMSPLRVRKILLLSSSCAWRIWIVCRILIVNEIIVGIRWMISSKNIVNITMFKTRDPRVSQISTYTNRRILRTSLCITRETRLRMSWNSRRLWSSLGRMKLLTRNQFSNCRIRSIRLAEFTARSRTYANPLRRCGQIFRFTNTKPYQS